MNALIFNHINLLVIFSTGIKVENIYFCGNSNAKQSAQALIGQFGVKHQIIWDVTRFGQIKYFFKSLLSGRGIIVGDYRSKAGRLALLMGVFQKYDICFIDDGTNTFLGKGYDNFWSFFSSFSKFKFYSFLLSGGRNTIDITKQLREMASSLKVGVSSKMQRHVLVGCCYAERGYIDEDYYFEKLGWIVASHPITHYKPHREESPEKIARICRKFGLNLLDSEVPMELFFIDGNTAATYSFGSTSDVLVNFFSPTVIEQTVFELKKWRNRKQQKKYAFLIIKICEFAPSDIALKRI